MLHVTTRHVLVTTPGVESYTDLHRFLKTDVLDAHGAEDGAPGDITALQRHHVILKPTSERLEISTRLLKPKPQPRSIINGFSAAQLLQSWYFHRFTRDFVLLLGEQAHRDERKSFGVRERDAFFPAVAFGCDEARGRGVSVLKHRRTGDAGPQGFGGRHAEQVVDVWRSSAPEAGGHVHRPHGDRRPKPRHHAGGAEIRKKIKIFPRYDQVLQGSHTFLPIMRFQTFVMFALTNSEF